ncbi:alpha/beta fold hydrolase [Chitinophaga polysaccharea]|uniref:alpha/beta fold hydrolase n=1 Tax=Chitinophaga TaxID=79328 RepID=UPI0014559AE3|nr:MULTISPECIES: alpha/beta fold hydrolase [Chitinophaga]NLR60530.1 alpha/beta fold hydrolase [Chitinophaga polysaccharea]NLU90446.1 alpha/beta fold hydrolase [Chitinophaga sp. Ak27]
MIPRDETFKGTFPFAPHFSTAPGFNMHYVDEGKGPVVLCLHGEPTWGYLFRHLVRELANIHRVIAPDHMGFGKSETPAGRTYWLQDHIDNLEKLVLGLDLHDITLVMHDFGGPVGMGLAARHPERIAAVVSVNGPVAFGQPGLPAALEANAQESPWFRWILQAAKEERLESVLNESSYNILSTLKLNGFERNDLITPTWLEAYGAPFPTPADCAGVLGWAAGFAAGAHQFEKPDSAALEKISHLPALAIWGTADRTLHAKYFLPLFRSLFPEGEVYELPQAGHYSLEDAPDAIGALITRFLEAITVSVI